MGGGHRDTEGARGGSTDSHGRGSGTSEPVAEPAEDDATHGSSQQHRHHDDRRAGSATVRAGDGRKGRGQRDEGQEDVDLIHEIAGHSAPQGGAALRGEGVGVFAVGDRCAHWAAST